MPSPNAARTLLPPTAAPPPERQSRMFPEKVDERDITTVALTPDFLIYATSKGAVQYFSLTDWTPVSWSLLRAALRLGGPWRIQDGNKRQCEGYRRQAACTTPSSSSRKARHAGTRSWRQSTPESWVWCVPFSNLLLPSGQATTGTDRMRRWGAWKLGGAGKIIALLATVAGPVVRALAEHSEPISCGIARKRSPIRRTVVGSSKPRSRTGRLPCSPAHIGTAT